MMAKRTLPSLLLLITLALPARAADPPAERDWTLDQLRQLLARDLHDAESRRLEGDGKIAEAVAAGEKVVATDRALRPDSEELANGLLRLGDLLDKQAKYDLGTKARSE